MKKFEITPEWCAAMAAYEGEAEIGAGSPDHPLRAVYMGGVTVSCGAHPSLPKKHRWKTMEAGGSKWRECVNCALTKDLGK